MNKHIFSRRPGWPQVDPGCFQGDPGWPQVNPVWPQGEPGWPQGDTRLSQDDPRETQDDPQVTKDDSRVTREIPRLPTCLKVHRGSFWVLCTCFRWIWIHKKIQVIFFFDFIWQLGYSRWSNTQYWWIQIFKYFNVFCNIFISIGHTSWIVNSILFINYMIKSYVCFA